MIEPLYELSIQALNVLSVHLVSLVSSISSFTWQKILYIFRLVLVPDMDKLCGLLSGLKQYVHRKKLKEYTKDELKNNPKAAMRSSGWSEPSS